jgi:hypothetical protein
VNKDVDDIKKYGNVAKMDLFGLEYEVAYPLIHETPLSSIMKKVILIKNGMIEFSVNDTSINTLLWVMDNYPKFPFSYYAMSQILIRRDRSLPKIKGTYSWVSYAYKALEILKVTTTIEGHKNDHDLVLSHLIKIVDSFEAPLKLFKQPLKN